MSSFPRLLLTVLLTSPCAGCYFSWDVPVKEVTRLDGFRAPAERELTDKYGFKFSVDEETELRFHVKASPEFPPVTDLKGKLVEIDVHDLPAAWLFKGVLRGGGEPVGVDLRQVVSVQAQRYSAVGRRPRSSCRRSPWAWPWGSPWASSRTGPLTSTGPGARIGGTTRRAAAFPGPPWRTAPRHPPAEPSRPGPLAGPPRGGGGARPRSCTRTGGEVRVTKTKTEPKKPSAGGRKSRAAAPAPDKAPAETAKVAHGADHEEVSGTPAEPKKPRGRPAKAKPAAAGAPARPAKGAARARDERDDDDEERGGEDDGEERDGDEEREDGEVVEVTGEVVDEPSMDGEEVDGGDSGELPSLPAARSGEAALSRSDPLQAYLREVQRHPLLTGDEEKDLTQRYVKTQDVRTAARLVTANLRLVVKLAYEYRRAYKNIMDLIQEGNIGLMQAVKRYDPYRGVKLSSYAAWWIRAYILRFILNNWRLVKLGTTQAQRKLFFNLNKEKAKLAAQGIEPTAAEIASRLHVEEKEVVDMDRRLSSGEASLDAPVGDTDGRAVSRLEMMPSNATSPDTALEAREMGELVSDRLAKFRETLKGKDVIIFDKRMRAEEPLTLQELGDEFGISRERVRQLEARLTMKLRVYLKEQLGDAVGAG